MEFFALGCVHLEISESVIRVAVGPLFSIILALQKGIPGGTSGIHCRGLMLVHALVYILLDLDRATKDVWEPVE